MVQFDSAFRGVLVNFGWLGLRNGLRNTAITEIAGVF